MRFLLILGLVFISLFSRGSVTCTLRILNDPTVRLPLYLSINGIRQNESAAENIEVTGLPFEVYGIELESADKTKKTKTLVFLRLGSTSTFTLSYVGDQIRISEAQGTESPYNGKVLTLAFKESEIEEQADIKTIDFSAYTNKSVDFEDIEDRSSEGLTKTDSVLPSTPPDLSKMRFDADSMFRAIRERQLAEQKSEPCTLAMEEQAFRALKQNMRSKPSISDRLDLAVSSTADQCLSVEQIKDLLKLLDGDDPKIEFYRAIYTRITDFERRSTLFELFYFEASIKEIEQLQP
ncbi:MAG TPA: DUF4476 domain-containing protein [Luteibaculaceae bacterium]|nr:DUF4476 domain-containing protein [Luteibaculaceae bacterium]